MSDTDIMFDEHDQTEGYCPRCGLDSSESPLCVAVTDEEALPATFNEQWFTIPDTVYSVASLAVQNSELMTADDVLSYFEKPWKWPELYVAWLKWDGR